MARGIKSRAVAVARWQRGLAGAQEAFNAGVDALTDNPMTAAAAREREYVEGVQRAVADGRWRAGLEGFEFSEWKRRMKDKGWKRMRDSAQQGEERYSRFYGWLEGVLDGLQREILDNMPRGDIEDNLRRAEAFARALHGYKGEGRRAARGRR